MGQRGSGTYFDEQELAFLASIGQKAQEVYDFAEDYNNYGEPGFETFQALATLRRHYFLYEMLGQPGDKIVDTGDLPPKAEAVDGIEWLPRLIEKARAKLRGEMSDDLMYGCGGDRGFFKKHGIAAHDFLLFVMRHFDDNAAIVEFVKRHSIAREDA